MAKIQLIDFFKRTRILLLIFSCILILINCDDKNINNDRDVVDVIDVEKPDSTETVDTIPDETSDTIPEKPIEKEGYTLEFNDEFNDRTLNHSKWPSPEGITTRYNFNDSCINIFIDENTQPPNGDKVYNFRVSHIYSYKTRKQLTNGAFVTTVTDTEGYSTQYGYFEMRAKLPDCGGGGHCAWWMIGAPNSLSDTTKSAEIDIIEPLFSNVNNSYPKVHPWYDRTCFEWKKSVTNPGSPSKEYHIYAMEWVPSGLYFYYDNELIAFTANSPNYKMTTTLAIYTASSKSSWSGWDNGVYPKTFSIDYIRVWKKK